MSPEDLQICRSITAALTSKDRDSINYLFLEPVNPAYFPTYLDIVKRPMDLKTLGDNLENGTYATRDEFYKDCQLIFDNAVAFNKGRAESSFVVGLAKKMSAAFEREKKKAERRSMPSSFEADNASLSSTSVKKKASIKLKIKRSSMSADSSAKAAGTDEADSKNEEDAAPVAHNITKTKIKLSSKKDADHSTTSVTPSGGKKIKLKLNRGKQLPEGVVANTTTATSLTPKPETSTQPTSKNVSLESYTKIAPMNEYRRAQCYKTLSGLKRRQVSNCKWFLKPVSDAKLVKDYRAKIECPMDLGTISSKLDKNQYPSVAHFVLDLRRVFSNCLQYNTSVKDSFRPIVMECLNVAEDLLTYFIAKNEQSKNSVYPTLLYCWEECIQIIHTLTDVINPDDAYQTAHYFLHPVQFFCGGSFPENYLDRVSNPMDLGTIVQKLITACYDSPGAFVADCRLVIENCKAYYTEVNEESQFMLARANRLKEAMDPLLEKLLKFDQSAKGAAAKENANSKCMVIKKPEKKFLQEIMEELRATEYTDRQAKITEMATAHFERPVDTTHFPDYLDFVENPMDLETVDSKIEQEAYITPEDFEYDVSLIFKNCERYNTPKNNVHMVALGKYTSKTFRKLFSTKMRLLERGGSVVKHPLLPTAANRDASLTVGKAIGGKKRPLSPSQDEKPSKRVSIKIPPRTTSKLVCTATTGGKLAGGKKAARQSGKKLTASPSKLKIDLNAPVPMHVAIASIKESYPGRRQGKDLDGWELECLKFLKQLLKHPWISAERPKYIFHVPVDIIFPEIREAYIAKIKNPMDLTTAEAKLLQGVYQNADEFVSDIALIFSNALTFNREGYEIGEPMSCAYYEASTHLLKYSRWLSLEVLQSFLADSASSPVVNGCATEWDLTVQNRAVARKEMEDIVFNELIEKTEAGDKLSWSEVECEKLLKSLKHTSDIKHMTYFIDMSFPADYTAIISKPIAWLFCQEKLREKRYNTIGEIVADLRLIFSNALKYNDRVRSVSKISQMAYDSAIHMSQKLEQAIDRMLLSVSDRIGREKIDTITLHREMEAKERAEEELLKAQWEKDNPSATVEVRTKFRIQRTHRKRTTDFEFPFYDEEDDNEESHDDSLRNAKAIFEKQQKERAKMKAISLSIGMHVFECLRQRADAKAWACRMAYKLDVQRKKNELKLNAAREASENDSAKSGGDFVLTTLNADDRAHVKVSMLKPMPKKTKRKSGLSSL